jgi:hypothetical protein
MSQLHKEDAHYVAPRTEGSRHGIYASLACEFRNKMRRNQIAKLSENAELGCGWFGRSFYHLCRVTKLRSHANHFFVSQPKLLWDGCEAEMAAFKKKRKKNRSLK